MKICISVLLASLLLAAGCISVDSTRTAPATYPPIKADEVYVFQTPNEVPGPFTSVAIIYTSANANHQNEGKAIDAAKERAGKLGANGIIVGGFTEPSNGAKIGAAFLGMQVKRKGEMQAIHFDPKSRTQNP